MPTTAALSTRSANARPRRTAWKAVIPASVSGAAASGSSVPSSTRLRAGTAT